MVSMTERISTVETFIDMGGDCPDQIDDVQVRANVDHDLQL